MLVKPQLGCRRAIGQSSQLRLTCPEDPHTKDCILALVLLGPFWVSLTLPETPASHGTSARAYKKRPGPSNHRFLHLSPLISTRRRALLQCPSLTLIFSHLIYTLYNHHHFRSSPPPSRLLAEHRPHRRYWSPSRARRML